MIERRREVGREGTSSSLDSLQGERGWESKRPLLNERKERERERAARRELLTFFLSILDVVVVYYAVCGSPHLTSPIEGGIAGELCKMATTTTYYYCYFVLRRPQR